MTVRWK